MSGRSGEWQSGAPHLCNPVKPMKPCKVPLLAAVAGATPFAASSAMASATHLAATRGAAGTAPRGATRTLGLGKLCPFTLEACLANVPTGFGTGNRNRTGTGFGTGVPGPVYLWRKRGVPCCGPATKHRCCGMPVPAPQPAGWQPLPSPPQAQPPMQPPQQAHEPPQAQLRGRLCPQAQPLSHHLSLQLRRAEPLGAAERRRASGAPFPTHVRRLRAELSNGRRPRVDAVEAPTPPPGPCLVVAGLHPAFSCCASSAQRPPTSARHIQERSAAAGAKWESHRVRCLGVVPWSAMAARASLSRAPSTEASVRGARTERPQSAAWMAV